MASRALRVIAVAYKDINKMPSDIQEELKPFDEERAIKFLKLFGLNENFFKSNIEGKYDMPIQPSKLQAIIMEDRANQLINTYMKKECN